MMVVAEIRPGNPRQQLMLMRGLNVSVASVQVRCLGVLVETDETIGPFTELAGAFTACDGIESICSVVDPVELWQVAGKVSQFARALSVYIAQRLARSGRTPPEVGWLEARFGREFFETAR